jgi:membrane protein YqaA with SNARE-associated domain
MPTATIAAFTLFFQALAASAPAHPHSALIRTLLSFGIAGVFFISIVDSSFVPLPIPGITDIMIVVLAAQHANLFLLIAAGTAGSYLGGLFSYKVGHAGGMAFLENHVPKRIFSRVCRWMESHAILAIALPAMLPPPMPLSPFVLAAGALNMPRNKFLTTFTISRLLRHSFAAWLGIHYGPSILHLWNRFSRKWGVPILIALWSIILISAAFAFYRLWKTSRRVTATLPPSPVPIAPAN